MSTKIPHFEHPTGLIDGSNTVFTVSTSYDPGSVVVFVRGIPRVAAWDDGWFETNPTFGTVTLKEAPCPGDDVQIYWCEITGDLVECAVEPLQGQIEDGDVLLCGAISSNNDILACIEDSGEEVCGAVETSPITGHMSTLGTICGIISEC